MKTPIIIATLSFTALAVTGIVIGDEDHDEYGRGSWFRESRLDVAPVTNERYRSECGSCHFAYQPGLLPARSWEKLMGGLDDHFGDNAELSPQVQQELLDYLTANAADRADYKRSRRIAGSLANDEVPLRISDTLYFKRKHDEIPLRYVTGNPEIGSFSNCAACHTRADTGSYNEHQVRIPGVGRWED